MALSRHSTSIPSWNFQHRGSPGLRLLRHYAEGRPQGLVIRPSVPRWNVPDHLRIHRSYLGLSFHLQERRQPSCAHQGANSTRESIKVLDYLLLESLRQLVIDSDISGSAFQPVNPTRAKSLEMLPDRDLETIIANWKYSICASLQQRQGFLWLPSSMPISDTDVGFISRFPYSDKAKADFMSWYNEQHQAVQLPEASHPQDVEAPIQSPAPDRTRGSRRVSREGSITVSDARKDTSAAGIKDHPPHSPRHIRQQTQTAGASSRPTSAVAGRNCAPRSQAQSPPDSNTLQQAPRQRRSRPAPAEVDVHARTHESQAQASSSESGAAALMTPQHRGTRPSAYDHSNSPTTHMSPDHTLDFPPWSDIMREVAEFSAQRVAATDTTKGRNERARRRRADEN
jgi:hypothetical protein